MGQFEISDWVGLPVTGNAGALARRAWPGRSNYQTFNTFERQRVRASRSMRGGCLRSQ